MTVGADHAATAVLTIYTDANDWSTATVTIAQNSDGTATQEVFVPFSSFATGSGASGGATFSNVGAMQLGISGPAATEAQVADIAAAGPAVLTQNFTNAAEADLAIVKTATPSPVDAGNTLTYTFTATNNGPCNATGVKISDTLPSDVTYVSATPSQGTASIAGGVLTVSLGNLADGATATTTVVVTVNSSASGTIPNTATIAGNENDPNMANNTSTVQTPVTADADLAIVKTATPSPVNAGNTLTYTFTATNNGPSNATGVKISDTLPSDVTYVSATPSQGTASIAGGVLTVSLGNLADGATATTTVVVTVNSSASGTIPNTATIAGNENDPNMANNTSNRADAGDRRRRPGDHEDRIAGPGRRRKTACVHVDDRQQRPVRRHWRHRHGHSARRRCVRLVHAVAGFGERQRQRGHCEPGRAGPRRHGNRDDHGQRRLELPSTASPTWPRSPARRSTRT